MTLLEHAVYIGFLHTSQKVAVFESGATAKGREGSLKYCHL